MVRPKMGLPLLLAVALLVGRPDGHVDSFAPPRCLSRQHRLVVRKYMGRSSQRGVGFVLCAAGMGAEPAEMGGDSDGDLPSPYIEGTRRTLYEVLRCDPTATRAELKQSYVTLARQTHPDALIGLDPSAAASALADLPDFDEVARAWKTLSDPRERKRYDRSLRADAFSKEIEDAAGRAVSAAAPKVKRMIDRVAMPFVRRTTATTVATFEAARQDLNGTGNVVKAFSSAVRASKNARRAIDKLELTEKAEELEGRAEVAEEKALRLRDELSDVMDRRLGISLRTPDSPLSSLEALKILDGFNTVDSVSLVESIVMLRRTLTAEIAALEEAEREYYELFDEKATVQKQFTESEDALKQAEVNAQAAVEAERRAREALSAAEQLVASSQRSLEECARNNNALQSTVKMVSLETDRSGTALKKRQERVRKALLRKKEALKAERDKMNQGDEPGAKSEGTAPMEGQAGESGQKVHENTKIVGGSVGDTNPATNREGYGLDISEMANVGDTEASDTADEENLEELQKRERYLTAESARLEDRAARLRSRANKLFTRASGLS